MTCVKNLLYYAKMSLYLVYSDCMSAAAKHAIHVNVTPLQSIDTCIDGQICFVATVDYQGLCY